MGVFILAKSALEAEINKQLRRIKSLIKRAEKRGYTFPSYKPPKVPERITKKTLEKLKKVTPEAIYKKAKYTIPDTGKTITGTQARKIERSTVAKKAAQARKLRLSPLKSSGAGGKEERKFETPDAGGKEERKFETPDTGGKEERKFETSDAIDVVKSFSAAGKEERKFEKPDIFDAVASDYAEKLQEQKRINEQIDRWKIELPQRGYLLPKGYLDELKDKVNTNLQDMSLEGLKDITEEALLSSKIVKFKDPMTGTIFTGAEGQEKEKLRAEINKRHQVNIHDDTGYVEEGERVLELVQEYIEKWTPSELWSDWFKETKDHDKNVLKDMLEGAIRDEGADAVAERMQENSVLVWELVESILYESGGKEDSGRRQIHADLVTFSTIITGKAPTPDKAIELANLMESYEVY